MIEIIYLLLKLKTKPFEIYCDRCREFINHWLPRFREENPQFEIEETMKRGRHPYLDAKYSELNFKFRFCH